MEYHYTYRITNVKISKHYIGVRTSKINPKLDLGIKYFSSSSDKEFIKDQKENQNNYKYKIIKIFNTRGEALNLEIKLHNKFDVGVNESFYNRAKQTSTNFDTTNISHNRNKGSNNPMFGEIRLKHSKKMSGINNPFYGKQHSIKTKQEISIKTSNQVVAKNKITGENLKVSKSIFDNDENLIGVTTGYIISDETKTKISKALLGKVYKKQKRLICPHCEKHIALNQAKRWHFDNCKERVI